MENNEEEKKSKSELQKEIKRLKKRARDLERERDILLALHKMELEEI